MSCNAPFHNGFTVKWGNSFLNITQLIIIEFSYSKYECGISFYGVNPVEFSKTRQAEKIVTISEQTDDSAQIGGSMH